MMPYFGDYVVLLMSNVDVGYVLRIVGGVYYGKPLVCFKVIVVVVCKKK